jgi:hypothetical protein
MDNQTIVAIGALLLALVAVILAIRKGTPTDKALAAALEGLQANREAMSKYETFVAEREQTTRQIIESFVGIIKIVAPLTPILSDDELAKLGEDVLTPGAPTAAS